MRSQSWVSLLFALCLGCGENDAPKEKVAVEGAGASVVQGVTDDGYAIVTGRPSGQAGAERPAPRLPDTSRWALKPTEVDPHGGSFSLSEAVEGMPLKGKLIAEIRTDLGFFFCDLFAERKPKTVAHFIGLARGKRAWWDARIGKWSRGTLFSDAAFHSVVPESMIRGGGYGDGLGEVGFSLPFEETETPLLHDRKGQLLLLNGGAEFAITDGPNRSLDGKKTHSIFGQCYPEDLAFRIARVPQWGREHDYRPRTKVAIHKVIIRRSQNGASKERPALPGGLKELPKERGASRGPSHMHGRSKRLRDEALEEK